MKKFIYFFVLLLCSCTSPAYKEAYEAPSIDAIYPTAKLVNSNGKVFVGYLYEINGKIVIVQKNHIVVL